MADGRSVRGPLDSSLAPAIDSLVQEVDEILASDRWALVPSSQSFSALVWAAVTLRHCCALLVDLNVARNGRRESAVRVLGRAHLEAWWIAIYIHLGKDKAVEDMASGWKHSIETWNRSMREHDDRLRREIRQAEGRNAKIRVANEEKLKWNASHPYLPPKELVDEVEVPKREPLDLDLSAAVEDVQSVEAERFPLRAVMYRLNELAQDSEGGDARFDVAYDVAYRALSNFGAHPTLFALRGYIDSPESSQFTRTSKAMNSPSMASAVLHTAVMQTAYLASAVLGDRGTPTPVADDVLSSYETTRAAQWSSPTHDGR